MKKMIFITLMFGLHIPFNFLISQTEWEPLGPFGGTVNFISSGSDGWFYTGISESGLFRSSLYDRTWKPINAGLPGSELYAFCAAPDGRLFCGGENMLAVSTDGGAQWKMFNNLPSSERIKNILVLPDSQIIISYEYKEIIHCSSDNGRTWRSITGIPARGGWVNQLQRGRDETVLVTTEGQGLYQLTPRTGNLVSLTYDLPKAGAGAFPYYHCTSCIVVDDHTILMTCGSGLFTFDYQTCHWKMITSYLGNYYLFVGDDSLYYSHYPNKLKVSADHGNTWTDPWPATQSTGGRYVSKVGGTFITSWSEGIRRTDDTGRTWSAADEGIARTDITCILAPSADQIVIGTSHGGIFRSTDCGSTWSNILFPPPAGYRDNIIALKQNSKHTLFAASMGASRSVWRSTNDGASWTMTAFSDSGIAQGMNFGMTDLVINGRDEIFVSGFSYSSDPVSGIFSSTDDGMTWNRILSAPENSAARCFLLLDSSVVLMGTAVQGFFRSTDLGLSWTKIQGTNGVSEIKSIVQDSASILLAATLGSGIMRSTDLGLTWAASNTGLSSLTIRSISKLPNGMILAGTDKGGYLSNDHGVSWIPVTPGASFTSVNSAFADAAGTVYLATDAGLFKARSLSITSVPEAANAPAAFLLSQNYPNPFNPSTTISFSIPSKTFVTLKIYDALGRDVATIVSDELAAGTYQRRWNASGNPSGVYFYRLQAGTNSETKRLILLR